jgi:MFS family permease
VKPNVRGDQTSNKPSTSDRALSPAFRQYLAARALGAAANQMLGVALGWQVYDLTGRAWDLGLVGLVQFLPAFLLTVPAGHLVDSMDRKKLLAASLAMQASVALVMCWGSVGQWIERDLILLLCLLLGASRALQLPAQQALIPSLVPAGAMPRSLALNAAVNKMATIGGPALGGFLYMAGAGVVYAICTLMLLTSMVCAWRISVERHERDTNPVTLRSLLAGIQFVRGNPVVMGAIAVDMWAVVLGGVAALLPIYAKDVLHTGPWGLGLLRSAPALGGLLMSAWMAHRPFASSVGRVMFTAVFVYGVATGLFALSSNLFLSLALLTVVGGADLVSTVLRHALVQMSTPRPLLGRVSAVGSTAIVASNQLGQFRAGAMAEFMGPIAAALLGGVGILVSAAWCMRAFPTLVRRNTYSD